METVGGGVFALFLESRTAEMSTGYPALRGYGSCVYGPSAKVGMWEFRRGSGKGYAQRVRA